MSMGTVNPFTIDRIITIKSHLTLNESSCLKIGIHCFFFFLLS
jgi:hypothetical protein